MKHERIRTNGISLHVVTDGPEKGPLVLMLHGFPEFWYSWRNQIPFFADRGFCVWAPDQRGYHESDKPEGLRTIWYIFFFQIPLLPELAFKRRDGRVMAASMRKTARKGPFSEEDLQKYREAWAKPGAACSSL